MQTVRMLFLLHLQSLTVLLKALAGDGAWRTYTGLLHHSHAVTKDHSTAIETAKFVQQLVTGVGEKQFRAVPAQGRVLTAAQIPFWWIANKQCVIRERSLDKVRNPCSRACQQHLDGLLC